MSLILQLPAPANIRGLALPIDPTDAVPKEYVDGLIGGTVLSGILQPLITSDQTTSLSIAIEGVGNTVIQVTGDVSATFPIGKFIGALTDPNAYLIISSVVTLLPTVVTTLTLGSPLKQSLGQDQFICIYRLNNSATLKNLVFDDGVLVNNANGVTYVQSKYKPIYGTAIPTNATLGYLGQIYVQDVSTPDNRVINLWVSVTPPGTTDYTWIEVFGGGGGTGGIFGDTSVIVANFRNYSTQPNPPYWIPTDSPNRLFGAAMLPWGVTTNQFSENTGEGTIFGTRYIDSQQQYDVDRGNALIFPQNLTPNSNIDFKFINNIFKFDCVFTTALVTGGVGLDFIIAPASVIAALQNPTDYAIAFLNGGQGDERINWLTKPVASVVNNLVNNVMVSTVTVTGGNGYIKGDFRVDPITGQIINYVGSQDPYYLFFVVNDTIIPTNACISMTSVVMSQDTNVCSYAMDMYIGLQGNGGSGPTPSGGTVTSASLTVTPTATGVDIEVPNLKAIPFYNTVTPGKALASIGSDGTVATTKISITNTSTSDPISTGGVGTVTVGNQGDTILNTSTIALWVQITPPVIAPAVQTYNWVRVNTSPTPPPAGVTSLNALTGIVNAVPGTNMQITTDPITKQITFISTATGPANPLTLYSDTRLPPSGTGQNGDFYLQYNTSATPFLFYRKNETQWVATSFFGDIAQNNSLQLAEKNTFADLLDGDLFPDFSDASDVANVLNSSTTTTRLSFINLYVSIVTTGVSDTNVGILQSKLKVGLVLQSDGGSANPVIGSWQFIITSVTPTGTVVDSKTVTILGHLKPSDDFSLNQLKSVGTATISNNIWTYSGGGIFVGCEVPLFVGYYLGYDPVEGKVTYLALPPPPPITKVPTDIQTFYLSVDGNGQAGTILFDTVLTAKTQGTAFGTMSNGVFTASRAVKCTVNITFNLSGNPAGYGRINDNAAGSRYNEFDVPVVGALKMPVSQIVPFASGDNYRWNTSQAITVFGGLTLGTTIEFKAEN